MPKGIFFLYVNEEGVRIPVGPSKNMMLIATKNKDY
jgi:hypothetical protein